LVLVKIKSVLQPDTLAITLAKKNTFYMVLGGKVVNTPQQVRRQSFGQSASVMVNSVAFEKIYFSVVNVWVAVPEMQ
jgi:hypothetical protein